MRAHEIGVEFDQQQPLGRHAAIQQGFGKNTSAGAKFENWPFQRKVNLTGDGFAEYRAGGQNGPGIADGGASSSGTSVCIVAIGTLESHLQNHPLKNFVLYNPFRGAKTTGL